MSHGKVRAHLTLYGMYSRSIAQAINRIDYLTQADRHILTAHLHDMDEHTRLAAVELQGMMEETSPPDEDLIDLRM